MLIRHGETAGNQKQRYIGRRTDEPLLPQSQEVLKQLDYGEPQAVYASPMLRCTQTASILFPGKPLNIIDELAECDFGEFENKNYLELDGNANCRHGSIPADFFHSGGRAGKNLSEETSPDFRWQLAAASAKIFPAPHWWYMAAPL